MKVLDERLYSLIEPVKFSKPKGVRVGDTVLTLGIRDKSYFVVTEVGTVKRDKFPYGELHKIAGQDKELILYKSSQLVAYKGEFNEDIINIIMEHMVVCIAKSVKPGYYVLTGKGKDRKYVKVSSVNKIETERYRRKHVEIEYRDENGDLIANKSDTSLTMCYIP